MRRRKKYATKATREPIRSGRGVFHSTDLMLVYHAGTLSGSDAYSATSSTRRLITTWVKASRFIGGEAIRTKL